MSTELATRDLGAAVERVVVGGDVACLPLSGKRGEHVPVLVDAYLLPLLLVHKWFLDTNGYIRMSRAFWGHAYLHRMILGLVKGEFGDHINGDRLDCREANLRKATRSENNRNIGQRSDSKQPFKGVRLRTGGRWAARIVLNKKEKHLGMFDSPEEAAIAYNEAAKLMFGDFARKVIL